MESKETIKRVARDAAEWLAAAEDVPPCEVRAYLLALSGVVTFPKVKGGRA